MSPSKNNLHSQWKKKTPTQLRRRFSNMRSSFYRVITLIGPTIILLSFFNIFYNYDAYRAISLLTDAGCHVLLVVVTKPFRFR